LIKDDLMDFPLQDFMDENACYAKLVELLHPAGLCCPRCHARTGLNIHRRDRDPVLDYRCRSCGRVFNAFTGTVLEGTPKRPSQVMLILRGIAQGTSTARLARELGLERTGLLDFRHRLQGLAEQALDETPLPDETAEADEMYQNAGEKRHSASRSGRPTASPRQQSSRSWQLG
jgi:transposase-like protein